MRHRETFEDMTETLRFSRFSDSLRRVLGSPRKFRVGTLKSLVWVPDLEIVNKVPSEWTDGSTASKAKIFYTGRRGSPE